MRKTRRAAVIRAFVGIFMGSLGVNCNILEARADDTSAHVIEAPSPPHRFGDRGDVVIPVFGAGIGIGAFGNTGGALSFDHQASTINGSHSVVDAVSFAPTVDWFVARRLSVGLETGISYIRSSYSYPGVASTGDNRTLALSFVPRIGYAFPIGGHFAFWPRVAAGVGAYDAIASDGSFFVAPSAPWTFAGHVDLDLVYEVDRHLYVGFDPHLAMVASPREGASEPYFAIGFGNQLEIGFVL